MTGTQLRVWVTARAEVRPRALDNIGQGSAIDFFRLLHELEGGIHGVDHVVGKIRVHHIESGDGVELKHDCGLNGLDQQSAASGILRKLRTEAAPATSSSQGVRSDTPNHRARPIPEAGPRRGATLRNDLRSKDALASALNDTATFRDLPILWAPRRGISSDESVKLLLYRLILAKGLLCPHALLDLLVLPLLLLLDLPLMGLLQLLLSLRLPSLLRLIDLLLLVPGRLYVCPGARQHDAVAAKARQNAHLNRDVGRDIRKARHRKGACTLLASHHVVITAVRTRLPLHRVIREAASEPWPREGDGLGSDIGLQRGPLRRHEGAITALDEYPSTTLRCGPAPPLPLLHLLLGQEDPRARGETTHHSALLQPTNGGRFCGWRQADVHEGRIGDLIVDGCLEDVPDLIEASLELLGSGNNLGVDGVLDGIVVIDIIEEPAEHLGGLSGLGRLLDA
mmetsp:Transcript_57832/g.124232  ORF Transcript_57832/g.124232 Transcript_57832/m.124232 type:complete len:453 (+) Transcript_57832:717-2075(+)